MMQPLFSRLFLDLQRSLQFSLVSLICPLDVIFECHASLSLVIISAEATGQVHLCVWSTDHGNPTSSDTWINKIKSCD